MQDSMADSRARDLLIVDDDASQARLFEHVLRQLGLPHRCHHSLSGTKALQFLRRQSEYSDAPRPELIILDVNMPDMDGCAVLREIKSDSNLRRIPVVMFSGGSNDDEIRRCYREHANAYVQKPVDFEANVCVVRAIERFWFDTVALPK